MLLDWLTLRLQRESCPDWSGWEVLQGWGDRILRICPKTGEVRWSIDAWESVRSDSHQIAIKASASSLHIQGSPARVMGDGDTVFGSGEQGRDVAACARAMIDFAVVRIGYVSSHGCLPVMAFGAFSDLPSYRLFRLTRADITKNYLLCSAADVRVTLSCFRNVEGGRYRVSQQAGDTVYWSHKSQLRAGKAYAKGPHLKYLMDQKTYTGCVYSAGDLDLASRLVRLELRLGSDYLGRLRKSGVLWYNLPWSFWSDEHDSYFGRMVGGVEVSDMSVHSAIDKVTPTSGQARAVQRTWAMINLMGWQAARESMPKRTWYLHLQFLRAAGLGDADISAGRVVALRRQIVLSPVSSWEELRRAA